MELSLPAGNLHCAVTAFENGADSIYFGLDSFSARAGAENFSVDDFRRIREYSLEHNKKIYIALNTIVRDSELKDVFKFLSLIDFIGCDGVLVQDFGIVNLIKKHFPHISLHASTQMAVQNADGVKVLQKLGFRRVVLARELSMNEIKKIRKECPDIELKVFIHGALCYGISGLCYASANLIGRGSANCGTCAQVCRMKFKNSQGIMSELFSLQDIISDRKIIDELKSAGIDSVKVEGRLKGPVYVKWAARYYRSLIDGKSDAEVRECREHLQSSFSRECGSGYFYDGADVSLHGYSGHRGCPAGEFVSEKEVRLFCDLKKHDGIMFFDRKKIAVKCPAPERFYKKGDLITLDGVSSVAGSILYKIKDSSDSTAKFNPLSLKKWLKPLDLKILLYEKKIMVSSEIFQKSFDIETARAEKKQMLYDNIEKAFDRESRWFRKGSLAFENHTGLKDNEIFVPASLLKGIALAYYEEADRRTEQKLNKKYVKSDAVRECTENAEVALSPVVFDSVAPSADFFSEHYVEINNISQILHIMDNPLSIKGIVAGPYFNIANAESFAFFSDMFGLKLIGAYSFVEGKVSSELKSLLLDGEKIKKTLPVFIHRNPDGKSYINVWSGCR